MAHYCPWWLGYALILPMRRWWQNPVRLLSPYLKHGMTVLEPGPGMGFFTLDLARLVGPTGRVAAADMQPRMLDNLKRRAAKAGVEGRIETRLVTPESFGLDDLAGKVDFVLAFYMVHEVPDKTGFFREMARAVKPGGKLYFSEPRGHVKADVFEAFVKLAEEAGFEVAERPVVRSSITAVLVRK